MLDGVIENTATQGAI